MKVTDKYVFFWSEWPSNWAKSHFTVKSEDGKDLEFYNSEQYFMWVKAKTFGDEVTAMKILFDGKNPRKAKDYGRMVKNYDDNVWNEKRYQVMLDANMYKYSQNEELRRLLLTPDFENKHFVEASKYDTIWGVGLTEDNPLIDDEKNWKGQNLLGKALDEVRERLIEEKMTVKIP